jgi:hypothetical protein
MQLRSSRRKAPRCQPGLLPGLAVLCLAAVPALAGAASPTAPTPRVEWRGEPQRPGLTLDRAVALAEQRYHARVVRAEVSDAAGRRVYVLKLLSEQGRVWTVRVDAETGAMN